MTKDPALFDWRSIGDLVIFDIRGDADLSNAEGLRDSLTLASANGATLVIDLTHCTFMDSTALGVLIGTYNKFGKPWFPMVVPRESFFRRLFKVAGVEGIFSLYERLDDVIVAAKGEASHRSQDSATASSGSRRSFRPCRLPW